MMTEDKEKLLVWMNRSDTIVGSYSYIVNGYPEMEVTTLKETLEMAAADVVDWRRIYGFIYEQFTLKTTCPPLPTCQSGYARTRTSCITPHPLASQVLLGC